MSNLARFRSFIQDMTRLVERHGADAPRMLDEGGRPLRGLVSKDAVRPLQRVAALALLAAGCAAQAADCTVPGDGTPLRRALLKVKYLPETEAWELAARKTAPVQYVLDVAGPVRIEGRCYWQIEVRSAGELWNRFYATSRGETLRVAGRDGRPLTLGAWRKTIR